MKKIIIYLSWLGGTLFLLMWPYLRLASREYYRFINPEYVSLDKITLFALILHLFYAIVWFIVLGLANHEAKKN